jgi:hypothetical protein
MMNFLLFFFFFHYRGPLTIPEFIFERYNKIVIPNKRMLFSETINLFQPNVMLFIDAYPEFVAGPNTSYHVLD